MSLFQIYLEFKFLLRRKINRPQKWQIFGQKVELPNSNRLPVLQRLYPTYDTYYATVFNEIERSYPGSFLIDVGANVGDTSVGVIRCAPSFQAVAVEGNDFFISFLKKNIEPFQGDITLVPSFVRCESVGAISYTHDGSTGGFVHADSQSEQDFEKVSVSDLLSMSDAHLVIWKSDTDGLDVPIVLENFDLLCEKSGIWWLELDPNMDPTNLDMVVKLINVTSKINRHYLLFDNYGNKLLSGEIKKDENEIIQKFRDIPDKFKRGSKDARYYDIFMIDVDKYSKLASLF